MANMVQQFCAEVFASHSFPDKWINNAIVLLPKKGDLSLMSNHKGITLMSIAATRKLFYRMREHVVPILSKETGCFGKKKKCKADAHPSIIEAFESFHHPLTVTIIDL